MKISSTCPHEALNGRKITFKDVAVCSLLICTSTHIQTVTISKCFMLHVICPLAFCIGHVSKVLLKSGKDHFTGCFLQQVLPIPQRENSASSHH